jgi:cobalt/nickel transport system permease protein
MPFDKEYLNLGYIDRLSYGDSLIHRIDPRGKVISTFLFVTLVISYPKYEVVSLLPYFLFPILLLTLSDTPFMYIFKRLLIVSPFAIFIGIFNPLFDPGNVVISGGISISSGWISFLSIMLKFILTISAALILIATTSFPGVCRALHKLGVPALFTSQLLFLYRYLFVLAEETMRMMRARDMRSFRNHGPSIRTAARLIGVLFMRTVERSERIYNAMLCRGFQGDFPAVRAGRFSMRDAVFIFVSSAALIALRVYNISELLGQLVRGSAG